MKIAIRSGKRAEADPAIYRCQDLGFLLDCQDGGLKGDWRRAAVAMRIKHLQEDAANLGEEN
jgi:hypothetical protein